MENEDSRYALFVEPNAYIQNYNKERKGIKKIIFSEPYESVPNFYINNNFEKHDCCCSRKPKPKFDSKAIETNMFDFKNILPLLSGLLGKGFDSSKLVSMLTNSQNHKIGNDNLLSNIMNILSSDIGKNILSLLANKTTKSMEKSNKNIEKIKSTDFCIKDYKKIN